MKRVYVAGAMSSSNPITFLDNLRKGMRLSTECLLAGYAVFSPFIDYSLFFQLRDGEYIPLDVIQGNSMAWVEVSDCLLVAEGWESSKGTEKEIANAIRLGIPVYFSLDNLKQEMPA